MPNVDVVFPGVAEQGIAGLFTHLLQICCGDEMHEVCAETSVASQPEQTP